MTVRYWALTGAALLLLSGCGGSGGEDDTSRPDDPVAGPPTNSLTLQGNVTDDPIDAANVQFRVGSQTFDATAVTGVNGEYEVTINYDDTDELVYGEALRSAGNIRFVGDVTTVGDLLARADNGVVDAGDITNVTTATFVLAERATSDQSIDSYAEFVAAAQGISADELLQVSAAIKVVVEAIDGAALPTGVADTLTLAELLAAGGSTFVNDLNTTAPGALQTAIERLLTDGFATEDFDPALVEGVYMSTSGAQAFALFDDGTGRFTTFSDGPVPRISRWRVNADGDLEVTIADDSGRTLTLQILAQTGDVLQLSERTAASGVQPAGTPVAVNYERYAFGAPFTTAGVLGRYDAPNAQSFSLSSGGNGLRFDSSGTVVGELTWTVDGEGRLVLDFGFGSVRTLTRLADDASGNGVRVLSMDVGTGGGVESFEVLTYS
ncbi:MAG: hypothetical protein AAF610_11465, partial [Pseudomonadota bacterium]